MSTRIKLDVADSKPIKLEVNKNKPISLSVADSKPIKVEVNKTKPIELPVKTIKINPDIRARGPQGPEGGLTEGGMDAADYDPQNIVADAFARSNHTGTQPASTISDFETEVTNNISVAANTAKRSYPIADENKLAGIESGAEVNTVEPADIANFETTTELNARDTANRSRANHTGTQLASTISDFDTEVSNNTSVAANTAKNSYPSADASKLAGIESNATADQAWGDIGGTLSNQTDLQNALNDKADDSDVVKLTGDQTVAGVKTFSSSPLVPAPTTNLQPATKKYVDDSVTSAGGGDMLKSVYDPANGERQVAFADELGSGSGDVVGPASSTDNAIARFDGTTGKLVQGSDIVVGDYSASSLNVNVDQNDITTLSIDMGGLEVARFMSPYPREGAAYLKVIANQDQGGSPDIVGISPDGNTNADLYIDAKGSGDIHIEGVIIKDGEVDGKNMDDVVEGPASSTDDGIAVFDGTSGKLIKDRTPVDSVDISTPIGGSVRVGETIKGTATPRDASTNVLTNRIVEWSSSDNAIAIVTGGIVHGVSPGSTSISASCEGVSSTSVGISVDPPAIETDTINEFTADNGVDIDGVTLKDGNVDGRDVSADGSKLDGIESNATADQTDAEIKTAYESNADTNAFTDSEQTKLTGIETGAEVNNISDANATDLTDAGDSALHFHSADRNRANHTGTQTLATLSDLANLYPVGTIYTNRTNSANPTTYLPGQSGSTWVARTDVMFMARGSTYTADGGSATHDHGLESGYAQIMVSGGGAQAVRTKWRGVDSYTATQQGSASVSAGSYSTGSATDLAGSTDSGSNIPPMEVVYAWERTA